MEVKQQENVWNFTEKYKHGEIKENPMSANFYAVRTISSIILTPRKTIQNDLYMGSNELLTCSPGSAYLHRPVNVDVRKQGLPDSSQKLGIEE